MSEEDIELLRKSPDYQRANSLWHKWAKCGDERVYPMTYLTSRGVSVNVAQRVILDELDRCFDADDGADSTYQLCAISDFDIRKMHYRVVRRPSLDEFRP